MQRWRQYDFIRRWFIMQYLRQHFSVEYSSINFSQHRYRKYFYHKHFRFGRFCVMQDSREKTQTELKICEKKDNLEIYMYNAMMDVIIPFVKVRSLGNIIYYRLPINNTPLMNEYYCDGHIFFWQNVNLSHLDLIGFYRSLVSCLNNLYQLENCNKDNLSNHLAANGYLKRFLYLTVQLP